MDLVRVCESARAASTEYLLDRVTAFRGELEGPAIAALEAELRARGVGPAEVAAHAAAREREGVLRRADGSVVRCAYCARPASRRRWGWHRLWGWFLPLFPRPFPLCGEHADRLPTDPHGRTLWYDADPGEQYRPREVDLRARSEASGPSSDPAAGSAADPGAAPDPGRDVS
jgi:hypothetical protein